MVLSVTKTCGKFHPPRYLYKIYYENKKEEIYDNLKDIPKLYKEDFLVPAPTIIPEKLKYVHRDRFDPKSLDQEKRSIDSSIAEGNERAKETKQYQQQQQQQVTGPVEVERTPTTETAEDHQTK